MKKAILGLLALGILSCQPKTVDQAAEAEKLMDLSREWSRTATEKNTEKVITYWAEDALLMAPETPTLEGRTAIRQMVEESMRIPGFEVSWEPQSAYVSKGGDLGYVIIKNYFKVPADTLGNIRTIYNKGVEIWKKQEDGTWQNVVDIYNGDPSITSIR